jgi:hypothetical protein
MITICLNGESFYIPISKQLKREYLISEVVAYSVNRLWMSVHIRPDMLTGHTVVGPTPMVLSSNMRKLFAERK